MILLILTKNKKQKNDIHCIIYKNGILAILNHNLNIMYC